jgi:hypothetical protein
MLERVHHLSAMSNELDTHARACKEFLQNYSAKTECMRTTCLQLDLVKRVANLQLTGFSVR